MVRPVVKESTDQLMKFCCLPFTNCILCGCLLSFLGAKQKVTKKPTELLSSMSAMALEFVFAINLLLQMQPPFPAQQLDKVIFPFSCFEVILS